VAGVFGFAALFHLMLAIPRERAWFSRKTTALAIYAPAAIACMGRIAGGLLPAAQRGGLSDAATTLCLTLVLLYFSLAVAALLQGYIGATRTERSASGLNVLAVCLLLGLAPMIPTAISLAAPGIVFPGGDYYDVVWLLIPFALTRAVVLQGRRAADLRQPRGI